MQHWSCGRLFFYADKSLDFLEPQIEPQELADYVFCQHTKNNIKNYYRFIVEYSFLIVLKVFSKCRKCAKTIEKIPENMKVQAFLNRT